MKPADPDAFEARRKALAEGAVTKRLAVDYREAERHAVRFRLGHRLVTALGILCGTAALLMGIANLGKALWEERLPGDDAFARFVNFVGGGLRWTAHISNSRELGLSGGAAVFVLVGLVAGLQRRWLYHRYRAERFRSLSFHVMIQPDHWTPELPSPNPWERLSRKELDAIERIGPDSLTSIAESEEPLEIPDSHACAKVDGTLVGPLIREYLERRLEHQIKYLERLTKRQESRGLPGASLASVVFFVSIVFVLAHFVAESLHSEAASGVLLFISAAIPTVWAGFRTWRGANEQERNATRSKAKLAVLVARRTTLEECIESDSPDPLIVFGTLAMAENLLRNELQEWLRLMLPAEWFS